MDLPMFLAGEATLTVDLLIDEKILLQLPLHLVGDTGDFVLDQLRRVTKFLDPLDNECLDLLRRWEMLCRGAGLVFGFPS
jgi:hypothetical protein